MSFVFMIALIWATTMGGWYFISKYVKSSDVDKIKNRLAGKGKGPAAAKAAKGQTQSLFRVEQGVKNRLAHALVEKYQLAPKMRLFIEQAGLHWAPARLIHLCIVAFCAGTIGAWMLPIPTFLDPVVGAAVGLGPLGYVWNLRRKRLHAFEEIFPEALEFVSRSMRAGHAFSVALEMLHREFQEPLAGEIRRTFEEHNLGLPIEIALQKLATRVPSMDVHFFVSAVLLQKRTGGNLAEILDKLAYIIRERFKLRGRIKTVSAHGRMTAITLSCIPMAVGCLMIFTNHDYYVFFTSDETGEILLGVSLALQLVGYAIMKKIVNIEV